MSERDALYGMVLGGYTILERIGQGGMASVYLAVKAGSAESNGLNKKAIKVLPRIEVEKDPSHGERFRQERENLVKLRNAPHVVRISEYDLEGDWYYIVMDYYGGGTLADRIEEAGRLSLTELLPLLRDIGAALDYAHRLGVIHRDIKPSNILFDEQNQAVLADFGIARSQEVKAHITNPNFVMGTLTYVAPEVLNRQEATYRSDLYSFGIVTYFALSGQSDELPFDQDTPWEKVVRWYTRRKPLLSEIRPNIPRAVVLVIDKMISDDPGKRYGSAGEFVRALEDAVDCQDAVLSPRVTWSDTGVIDLSQPGALEALMKKDKRRISLRAALITLASVVVVIVGSILIGSRLVDDEPNKRSPVAVIPSPTETPSPVSATPSPTRTVPTTAAIAVSGGTLTTAAPTHTSFSEPTQTPIPTATFTPTVAVPPTQTLMPMPGQPSTDLTVQIVPEAARIPPGNAAIYTVTIANEGAAAVQEAQVSGHISGDITGVSWNCALSSGSGSCSAAQGVDGLNLTVSLDPASAAQITLQTEVQANVIGEIVLEVNAQVPANIVEEDTANNYEVQTVLIEPDDLTDVVNIFQNLGRSREFNCQRFVSTYQFLSDKVAQADPVFAAGRMLVEDRRVSAIYNEDCAGENASRTDVRLNPQQKFTDLGLAVANIKP